MNEIYGTKAMYNISERKKIRLFLKLYTTVIFFSSAFSINQDLCIIKTFETITKNIFESSFEK